VRVNTVDVVEHPFELTAVYVMVTVPAAVPVKVAVPSLLFTKVAAPVPPVMVQEWVIGRSGLDGLPLSITEPFRQTVEEPVIPTVGLDGTVTVTVNGSPAQLLALKGVMV
jgi:hypothetical protein